MGCAGFIGAMLVSRAGTSQLAAAAKSMRCGRTANASRIAPETVICPDPFPVVEPVFSTQTMLGALLCLLALGWIVRAAIGIRRRQLTVYGRGGYRRSHHGHAAVWAGIVDIAIGLAFFLMGMGLVYVGSVR
jgi:hypothetical protein